MFTKDERRALLFLTLVAAGGGVLRVVRPRPEAPGAPLVAPEIRGDDLAGQVEAVRRATLLARPLRGGERVDVDRASAEEIERLPRVGTELARRIVAEREANGPFGSIEGLGRVGGVGPGTRRLLERVTTFSGVPLPAPPPAPEVVRATPGQAARARPPETREGCPGGPVAVNRAGAAELACLPGIGPALAERIMADRARRGAYRELAELERVPGIGPRLIARLQGRIAVP